MEIYYIKILESVVTLILLMVVRIATTKLVNKTIVTKVIQPSRGRLIRSAINAVTLLIFFIILMVIWGVNQSELAVFVGSALTIVGAAFFAQWSLLSNITSSIILFFGHSVKIGDAIAIMEAKEYEIRGEVLNIGLFFTKIRLNETHDEITMPNSVFIIKTVRKVSSLPDEPKDKTL